MEPLISVIVPVYKTEKYLRKCVDSILSQTYSNLEVILVDDGSPDGCPAICDEYAKKDHRVQVIHKKNEGQAIARNTALKIATGDYVTFVDSDDWVDLDLYEKVMRKKPFEVAVFGCTYVYPETVKQHEVVPSKVPDVLSWEKDGNKAAFLVKSSLLGYACNKIYSRKIVGELRFHDVKLREDLLFNIAVFGRTERIQLINCPGYYYVQHRESSLHKKYTGNIPDILSAAEKMTVIHPALSKKTNRNIANQLIKAYLCDALSKYIFRNQEVPKVVAIAVLRKIFNSRMIADTLHIYLNDPKLFVFLTVCIKCKLPRTFYHIAKRVWHE